MYQSHAGVYGPSKPTVDSCSAFSIASLVGSGEKMGTNPWIGRPTCCGLCRKPFFSRAVTLCNIVDDSQRVAICGPREIRMVLDHT
jgi:hypothetical protein